MRIGHINTVIEWAKSHKILKEEKGFLRKGQKKLETKEDPDEIEELKLNSSALPKGKYTFIGYETRQVHDLDISVNVKEYRAEVWEDQNGNLNNRNPGIYWNDSEFLR